MSTGGLDPVALSDGERERLVAEYRDHHAARGDHAGCAAGRPCMRYRAARRRADLAGWDLRELAEIDARR